MARVLVRGRWYESLPHRAQLESEFETIVEQHANDLFPGFTAVPFKADVRTPNGVRRGDLALVATNYLDWWVVEVEMSHHSLTGHVMPQVEGLLEGDYGPEHAARIVDGSRRQLEHDAVVEMIRGAQPKVLVVVDRPRPNWVQPLKHMSVPLAIAEVFRSDLNEIAIRLNGEAPRPPRADQAICRPDPVLPRSLQVLSPGILPFANREHGEIDISGQISVWTRIDTGDRVLLRPVDGDPLGQWRQNIVLELGVDGRLRITNE